MATHSSILAYEIPWTEELGRLQSMGSQTVRASASSSPEFLMTYSAYKLNKQGDNIQPCIGV